MTFEKAMMKLAEGRAVRHPDMNSRWALANSPSGVIQMSNVGGMLPYVACDRDHERRDWSVVRDD
jgi:hypothetical protein